MRRNIEIALLRASLWILSPPGNLWLIGKVLDRMTELEYQRMDEEASH